MVFTTDRHTQNVEAALRECFATDPELLRQWHIAAPGSLDACIARTMSDLNSVDSSFRFHRAYVGGDLVGYWGDERSGSYLNLIFVKPQFRGTTIAAEFWAALCKSLRPSFETAIYARNLPAVRFYSKHCTESLPMKSSEGHSIVAFRFSQEVI